METKINYKVYGVPGLPPCNVKRKRNEAVIGRRKGLWAGRPRFLMKKRAESVDWLRGKPNM